MSNVDSTIKRLNELIQLDIDAIHAYDKALERISAPNVSTTVAEFKEDHRRHVRELSDAVRGLGGEPPEFSRDLKGFLIEGFTALRSATGTEGALKAMRMNEKTTNKKYESALQETLPPDIEAIVRRNREDERRHLAFIERAIEQRLWETSESPRPSI